MFFQDGATDGNSAHAKLKLTIPKEPDFETTQRAQRMRLGLCRLLSLLKSYFAVVEVVLSDRLSLAL